MGKGCWPHPRVRSLSQGSLGGHCRYPEDRVPRVQASSQDNGSRLPDEGSSEAATCPHGLGSCSRLGAALGRHVPPRLRQVRGHHVSFGLQHPPSGAGQHWSCHVSPGLCGLQTNKQISSGNLTIMISIGAGTPVSSKVIRDKGCSAHSQHVQEATH
jgi:hypothetical protein